MKKFLKEKWVVPVATLVLTLSIGSAAFAATGSASTDTSASDTSTAVTSAAAATDSTVTDATVTDDGARAANGATSSNPWGNQRSDETLLTGATAEQVKAAALAKVGSDATVVRVETDSDASETEHAKYEAHVVKADGTAVTVYVDESFNVVSVEEQEMRGHRGDGDGVKRGDETLLTGTAAEQVKAAALAKVGSDATVQRVETDADSNAVYEAHVTKADGTCVTVYVDESFNVVSVED
jgi:uncharacterized membrane protein YkoI